MEAHFNTPSDTDILISKLDRTALSELACFHSSTLRKIRAKIRVLDDRAIMQKETREKLTHLKSIPARIQEFIDQGYDLDHAMRHTSQRMAGCQRGTIERYWLDWMKSRDDGIKRDRAAMIMRRVSKGRKNYEIADQIGVSEATVSRIVSRALKRSP